MVVLTIGNTMLGLSALTLGVLLVITAAFASRVRTVKTSVAGNSFELVLEEVAHVAKEQNLSREEALIAAREAWQKASGGQMVITPRAVITPATGARPDANQVVSPEQLSNQHLSPAERQRVDAAVQQTLQRVGPSRRSSPGLDIMSGRTQGRPRE